MNNARLLRVSEPFRNTFTWSKSRAATFDECRRKYRYQCYDYWDGWRDDAAELPRRLYKLRGLATLASWRGLIVHDTLEYVLRDFHTTRFREPLWLEWALGYAEKRMRAQWHVSENKLYWSMRRKDPSWFGLIEHELALPLAADTLEINIARVQSALTNVYASALWRDIATSDLDRWYSIDDRAFSHHNGVKIWSVPDLMYMDNDNCVHIVDWKTGTANRDSEMLQLAGYAAYAHLEHNIPLNNMRATLAYTQGVRLETYTWQPDLKHIRAFGRFAAASMRQMVEVLVPQDTLAATIEANVTLPIVNFPRTEDTIKCTRCPFQRECRPEGVNNAEP